MPTIKKSSAALGESPYMYSLFLKMKDLMGTEWSDDTVSAGFDLNPDAPVWFAKARAPQDMGPWKKCENPEVTC